MKSHIKKYALSAATILLMSGSTVLASQTIDNNEISYHTNLAESYFHEEARNLLLDNNFNENEFFNYKVKLVSQALEDGITVSFVGQSIITTETIETSISSRGFSRTISQLHTATHFGGFPSQTQISNMFPTHLFVRPIIANHEYTGTLARQGNPTWIEHLPGAMI